jgi:hypothetical protein
MNNKQLLSLIFFCAVIMAQAQSTRTYMFNFHKNGFSVENGGSFEMDIK